MKRALFVKTKNLGDAVVLTAAIRALPKDYVVDILCFQDCVELYSGITAVDRIWSVTRGQRGWPAILEGLSLIRSLNARRFDLLCHFSDDWRGAFLARFLRPAQSVAYRSARRGQFWCRSFNILLKRPSSRRHSADIDVDLLRRTKLFEGDSPAYIPPSSEEGRVEIENYKSKAGLVARNYVVVHLPSRWRFKELPRETSLDLVGGLIGRGYRVVLTGGKSDFSLLVSIRDTLQADLVDVCVGKSLVAFSELLRGATAVISIDSLAVHLASAHKVPVVAIFGPSGELNWRPWKTAYRVVSQSDLYPCRPCGMDGCAGSKVSECIRTMPASKILDALEELVLAPS